MKSCVLTIVAMMSVQLFCTDSMADPIYVANYSFESPELDAMYYITTTPTDWKEFNGSLVDSQNTGAFYNNPIDPAFVINAEGNQLAYLYGLQGCAHQQELSAVYQVGKSYRMTVGVCISTYQPPPADANEPIELAFYYLEGTEPNDLATALVPRAGQSNVILNDFSLYLPKIQPGNPCIGKSIGIVIRGTGVEGGAWDLDNVRVTEYPLVPNFTDDSIVNLADFAKMAADWLYCDDPLTDVTGEGCVNEDDLLVLMEYWLDNV